MVTLVWGGEGGWGRGAWFSIIPKTPWSLRSQKSMYGLFAAAFSREGPMLRLRCWRHFLFLGGSWSLAVSRAGGTTAEPVARASAADSQQQQQQTHVLGPSHLRGPRCPTMATPPGRSHTPSRAHGRTAPPPALCCGRARATGVPERPPQ